MVIRFTLVCFHYLVARLLYCWPVGPGKRGYITEVGDPSIDSWADGQTQDALSLQWHEVYLKLLFTLTVNSAVGCIFAFPLAIFMMLRPNW